MQIRVVDRMMTDSSSAGVKSLAYETIFLMRTFTLFIVDAMYESLHKTTAVIMMIFIVMCALIIVGQLVLYRKLDPRESKSEHRNGDTHLQQTNGGLTDSAEENEKLLNN